MSNKRLSKPLEEGLKELWNRWGHHNASRSTKTLWFRHFRSFARTAVQEAKPHVVCSECGSEDVDFSCVECGSLKIDERPPGGQE